MSELSEAEILSKPARLIALLSSGEEVRIVTGDGHVIGLATVQKRRATSQKSDMKAWAEEIQARLKHRFGNRVVAGLHSYAERVTQRPQITGRGQLYLPHITNFHLRNSDSSASTRSAAAGTKGAMS